MVPTSPTISSAFREDACEEEKFPALPYNTPMTQTNPTAQEPDDVFTRLMNGPSGPLAWAGFIIGGGAIWIFLSAAPNGTLRTDPLTGVPVPPSLLAVNLSFCGLFLAVATLYRIRQLPKQWVTRSIGILALLFGLAGPAMYSWQTLLWRAGTQAMEVQNVKAILATARTYAGTHEGQYPPTLAHLLDSGLELQRLYSPYIGHRDTASAVRKHLTPLKDTLPTLPTDIDYEYVGAGLRTDFAGKVPDFEKYAIVVFAKEARMRAFLTVGFMDGSVKLLAPEEVTQTLQENNQVRNQAGLPPLAPPAATSQPAAATEPGVAKP